jgi:hypothetical protein
MPERVRIVSGSAPEWTRWPHVTDVLAKAGLIDATFFTQVARDVGTAVHAAAHYLDEGTLDFRTLDPVIAPRLRSYQRFLDEMKPVILGIEETVQHEVYRYQGTLDRRVQLNGREAVIDLKGPYQAPWQAIQVAAYAGTFERPMDRYTLHLDDEKYQLVQHRGRRDFDVFKAALTLSAWRSEHVL